MLIGSQEALLIGIKQLKTEILFLLFLFIIFLHFIVYMVWFISFIHEVSSINLFIYVYFNASNDQKCIYFKAACN